ncbi:LysM peptidoglycan-binding domain-containing protein [Nakamurella sp. GG22]
MTRLLRVLASIAASVLLVAGVPALLASTIGNPADRLPDLLAGDVNNQVLLAALAAVVWLAWAQFTVAFVVELFSAVRRTPMPARIPGVFTAQQGLARALVSGALLLLPLTVSTVAPAAQAIAMTPATVPASTPAAAGATVAAAAPRPQVPTQPVTVTPDGARTWWDLAAAHLGDGSRWHELWDLNQGRTQDDGTVLRGDRTVLRPGWTVLVPAPAATADQTGSGAVAGDDVDVTVRPGDTLSEIAQDHGAADWTSVWQANAGRTEPDGERFTDPDYLEPGWTITIPAAAADSGPGAADSGDDSPAGTRVLVRPGDTLSGIAAAHGADPAAVLAANTGVRQPDGQQLTDPDDIEPGWTLTIPSGAAPSSAPVPGTADSARSPAAPSPGTADSARPPAAPAPGTADSARQPAAPAPGTADSARPPAAAAPGTADSGAGAAADAVAADSAPQGSSLVGTDFAVFAGGGGVLAALLLAALIRARRRQLRHRRPGELLAGTPAGLLAVERALRSVGGARAADAQWLDEALRGLGHTVAAGGDDLVVPDILAVCASVTRLRLVLADPGASAVFGAWSVQPDGSWTLDRGQPTGYDPERRDREVPPYPALATVGYTAGGEHWLLDLERVGALTLTGDAERAVNLARFLAAELAHNSWAELLQVTLVGFGAEMARMHPDRLTYTADPAAALAAAAAQRRSVAAVVDESGLPVLQGRGRGIAGDAWAPHVLLIAPDALPDRGTLTDLLGAITDRPDRSTVALVVTTGDCTDADAAADGFVLRVDEHGVLSIPALGLELIAQQIPAGQAGQLAQLLALAADTDRAAAASPLPAGTPASTHPRPEPDDQRWARADSALPLPQQVYLEQTATTSEDLQAMAPVVQADVRERLAATDRDLDDDVRQWTDPASNRPRIAVLGSITVHATGGASPRPLSAMKGEIAVYLAMHPTGVSPEQYGTDLWPDDPGIAGSTKLRNSIYELRRAFGVNARTGTEYLPRNAATTGALYRLQDVLVDAELFRRLRLRGFTRDDQADRLADWWQALGLVRGAPFSAQRPGGYGWLAARPVDHQYTATIVDLAHAVATHHLAAGEPDRAEAAAKVALAAAEGASDISLLDLVWACDAQDRRAEGDAHVKAILAHHDTDDLEDLPPRTYDVLRRRQFLPPAA